MYYKFCPSCRQDLEYEMFRNENVCYCLSCTKKKNQENYARLREEKTICECGITITKTYRKKHMETKIHKTIMENRKKVV